MFAFVEMEPRGLRRRAGVGVAGDGAAGGTKSSANDSITLAHWVDLCRELENELDAVRGGADRNDLCCELQGVLWSSKEDLFSQPEIKSWESHLRRNCSKIRTKR